MHIAIATTEFVTETTFSGGLSNFSANLADILRDHGHVVDVFVISNVNERIMWKNGIRVYRIKYERNKEIPTWIPTVRLRRNLLTLWCLFGMSYIINKKIKEEHQREAYDVIHFCDAGILFAYSTKSIPHVTRLSSSPCVWRAALAFGEQPFDLQKALKDNGLSDYFYNIAIRKEKNIIAPSHLIADIAWKKYRKKVTVIESPFCTSIDLLDDKLYREYLKEKRYFLFYGTLNFLKGIQNIGRILPQLFRMYPDYYFAFLGKDLTLKWQNKELRASELLIQMAGEFRNRVILIPPTSVKEQVYDVVSKAELIVLPSRVDNLPNTCIEAMSLGKIVVGTRGASFEQLIQDGYNGWLAEIDNPVSLLEKIERAMGMTKEKKALFGERARKRLESMNPKEFYKNIINVYQSIIVK